MNKTTKSAVLILAILIIAYLLTAKGFIEITDTYFSIQTAKSIIERYSLAIEDCRGGYCYESKDGKCYSKYGIGLPLLFIPYLLVCKSDFLVSFYNIFFGVGTCVILFYMLHKFFNSSLKVSVIMALLLGFATMCWRYSVWDFPEVAQMFFLTVSVYLVLKNTIKSILVGSLLYGFLILLKIAYLLYVPLFLIYILARNKFDIKIVAKKVIFFLSFILISFGFVLILNHLRFGDILEFGYGVEANMFSIEGALKNIPKLLFYLDKGIFIYNPIFISSVVGYVKFYKLFRREAIFFLSLIITNLVFTSMWHMWYGGWCWGPRLLVPMIPFWLMPLYIILSKKGIIRFICALFIIISLLIQLVSVFAGNLEYHLICNANNKEGLKEGMPAQIIGSVILMKHKILKNDNVYNLSEFRIDSDTIVDTFASECYRGLDFWYCYLPRIKK